MTELLNKAFKKAEKLPEELQDEIAKTLISDLEEESKWQNAFEVSEAKLIKIADKAIKESNNGKTKKLGFDEL